MKCSRCGTDNPEGKNVCEKCGNFLYSNRPKNRRALTRKEKSERRKKIFVNSSKGCLFSALIFIGVMIVLAAISYVLVVYILPDDMISQIDPNYSISETVTETSP